MPDAGKGWWPGCRFLACLFLVLDELEDSSGLVLGEALHFNQESFSRRHGMTIVG